MVTGVMGGQISITSWGWHNVALSNEPEKLLRLWSVTDMRAVEAGSGPLKHFVIAIEGPEDDVNKYDDPHDAFIYICTLGEEGLPDQ